MWNENVIAKYCGRLAKLTRGELSEPVFCLLRLYLATDGRAAADRADGHSAWSCSWYLAECYAVAFKTRTIAGQQPLTLGVRAQLVGPGRL